MLLECPDCQSQVSSAAAACPKCGHPVATMSQATLTLAPASEVKAPGDKRAPAFLIAAGVGLLVCLFTPRIIVALPVLATIVLGIVSLVRGEKFKLGSVLVIVLAVSLVFVSSSDFQPGHSTASAANYAKIDDWNWRTDPNFAGKGTVKWTVVVRNTSSKPIRNAKVEFTTYDDAGKVLASTFTYVDSIPVGETRSDDSYADYFGSEKTAKTQLVEVNFED